MTNVSNLNALNTLASASAKRLITETAPEGIVDSEVREYIAKYGVDAELYQCKLYRDGTFRLVFTLDGEHRSAVIDQKVQYGPLMYKKMRIVLDTETTPWTVVYPSPKTHPLEERVAIPKLPKERPAGL